MIGSHISEASLNDYVEGGVTGTALERAETHLAECVQCRDAVNRLGAVLEQLHALPRELDPGVDLMPSIRAETRRRLRARTRRHAQQRMHWPLAAAAALALVIAGAALTMLAIRSSRDGGAPGQALDAVAPAEGSATQGQRLGAGTDAAAMAELRSLEAEYARAADELLAAFREERQRLGAGTARLLEDNIETVERALRQSQQALTTDPDSPVLRELVLSAHRQRLDLARRAAIVAGES